MKTSQFRFEVETSFAGRQSQGARPYQEDSYGFSTVDIPGEKNQQGLLIILADGMGGLEDGRRASSLAVEVFNSTFIDNYEESEDIRFGLSCGLRAANSAVEEVNRELFGTDGEMGTTLVGAFIAEDQVWWISVGDSPLYVVRKGVLKRLNDDHSMRAVYDVQVQIGAMSDEEAKTAPEKSALLSAITGEDIKHVDHPENGFRLYKGDYLVAASDGIDTITTSEVAHLCETVRQSGAAAVAKNLIGAVLDMSKKNQDNVTVAVVEMQ